jgi:uncharacterized membrane protein (DUF106 family)
MRERKTDSYCSPLVWWVRMGEANKKIRELKKEIEELKSQLNKEYEP